MTQPALAGDVTRHTARISPSLTVERYARTKRGLAVRPWRFAIVLSLAIALPGLAAVAPLVDSATEATGAVAELRFPIGYLILAPLSDVLDALSLLSVRQHIALVLTAVAAFAVWRIVVRPGSPASWRAVLSREIGRLLLLLLGLVTLYAAMALLPRPMAALALKNPDEIAVDFHSHTNASHDGRWDFAIEDNRAWHEAAGFGAAYVTDHLSADDLGIRHSYPDARLTRVLSPGGTYMFTGYEVRCGGAHLVVLADTPNDALASCAPVSREKAPAGKDSLAVVILTLPLRIRLSAAPVGTNALELIDAAPRALDQLSRDSSQLLAMARRSKLALVAGSNNHGWGRTAAAWNVMRIEGWRSMDAAALDTAIRRRLLTDSAQVRIIERRRATPASSVMGLVGTGPAVAWNMLITLAPAERLAWLGWIWCLRMLRMLRKRGRRAIVTRNVRAAPRSLVAQLR